MNRATIALDPARPGARIAPEIYSHFSEHLGRCVYEGLWVGEGSPIPNVRGIRSDVVAALRRIRIPVLRWPGGCFADEYHWRDGVGPRASRPSIVNTHWGGVTENNHFGTHEFFDLCGQLGAAPYVCGNVGSGSVREMTEWVEYLTMDGASPMADLRRAHGRAEPWTVPYFGVGNENWGCGGNMRPEYYADLYRQYQTYVRNYGANRIMKIAGGPNEDDEHWTEVMMRDATKHMWGLSLHMYTWTHGPAAEFDEAGWFRCLKRALWMEDLVRRHSAIMDRYDPEKKVALVVDEWGTWHHVEAGTNPGFLYQQQTVRDALVAGVTLNIFNAHADRVRMANLAQMVNVLQAVILTDGPAMLLTPTYHVFDLYAAHQGAALLPVTVACGTTGAGADAVPVVSASASVDGAGRVHLTLCNLDPVQPVATVFRGIPRGTVAGRVVTGPSMQAGNTFAAPAVVVPQPFSCPAATGAELTVELPPRSVVALTAAS